MNIIKTINSLPKLSQTNIYKQNYLKSDWVDYKASKLADFKEMIINQINKSTSLNEITNLDLNQSEDTKVPLADCITASYLAAIEIVTLSINGENFNSSKIISEYEDRFGKINQELLDELLKDENFIDLAAHRNTMRKDRQYSIFSTSYTNTMDELRKFIFNFQFPQA